MADKKAILLRIPSDLWSALSRWARDDLRSVNAQIEWLLREAVRRRAGGRDPPRPRDETAGDTPPDEDAAADTEPPSDQDPTDNP